MTDFLHTYGAFILVVLVLLSLLMVLVFCRAFLSPRSDPDDAALEGKAGRLSESGQAHE